MLDQQESEFQTDNEKSKKVTAELSSINDKVSNKEGIVRTQREPLVKESKALEEALDEVREAECRLGKQYLAVRSFRQAMTVSVHLLRHVACSWRRLLERETEETCIHKLSEIRPTW